MASKSRRAFSLIELLVVLGIVSILMALLLPAVQSARDSARLTQCKSNLRQIGMGTHLHESTYQHFPGGGWGYLWTGLSDRGADSNQPGGWIFRILPFVEQQALYDTAPTSLDVNRGEIDIAFTKKPVSIFICPDRPAQGIRRADPTKLYMGLAGDEVCSSSDFAVNLGTHGVQKQTGPANLSSAASYTWPNPQEFDGLCFPRSQVRFADISDGLSNVIAVGERWLASDEMDSINNQTMLSGDTFDISRLCYLPPARDGFEQTPSQVIFGSRHRAGCQFVFCDGSVRLIPYSVDPLLFHQLGSRNDGAP